MGKHPHPQLVEHADGGAAGNVLRHPGEQKAPQPTGRQTQPQPQHQRLVEQPAVAVVDQAAVEQFTDEPGAQEHGEHQHQLQDNHPGDLLAHRPQQRQQALEHAAVEGFFGQHFFNFDIAQGFAGDWVSHDRSLAGRGNPDGFSRVQHGCRWR
ncbi:hypothetical protein D3C76_933310 [compost metagenome]